MYYLCSQFYQLTIKKLCKMTVAALFRKWDLKHTLFIKELNISKQGFSQKVNEKETCHFFTETQKQTLKSILEELSKDIKKIK